MLLLLFLLLHPVQGQLQVMFGIVVSGVWSQRLDIGLGGIPEIAYVVERISDVENPKRYSFTGPWPHKTLTRHRVLRGCGNIGVSVVRRRGGAAR